MIRKLLCPFCFQYINLHEVHWRCANSRCSKPGTNEAPGEPDEVLAQYQHSFGFSGPAPRLLHAFPSPKSSPVLNALHLSKLPKTIKCDWCKKPTPRRLCPLCHNDLPYAVDTIENHIIAIIGPKQVGKTHYIAVLIEQLRQQIGADFDFSLMALNDATTTRYQREFYNPLYREKKTLEVSQQIDMSPLMYRLKFAHDGNPLTRNKVLTLIFFDTAGENFDQEVAMSARTRYLIHSSAIILLVDPLQMLSVRNRLDGMGCPLPSEHTEPADIIERVVSLFHSEGGLSANKQISIPFAVSFTKSDVLRDYRLLPNGNAVYTQPRHQGDFNGLIHRQVHDEIQSLLSTWGGPRLDNLLKHDFADYCYTALSALGEAPDTNGKLSVVAPFRVEDPFLWILARLGYLRMTQPKEK